MKQTDKILKINLLHCSVSLARNPHLISSFSSLPRTLCSSSCLLQQSGDHIVCNVEELLVDLLVLTEIVIATKAVEQRRSLIMVRRNDWNCHFTSLFLYLLLVFTSLEDMFYIPFRLREGVWHVLTCNMWIIEGNAIIQTWVEVNSVYSQWWILCILCSALLPLVDGAKRVSWNWKTMGEQEKEADGWGGNVWSSGSAGIFSCSSWAVCLKRGGESVRMLRWTLPGSNATPSQTNWDWDFLWWMCHHHNEQSQPELKLYSHIPLLSHL